MNLKKIPIVFFNGFCTDGKIKIAVQFWLCEITFYILKFSHNNIEF